jgi:hypothetical protein
VGEGGPGFQTVVECVERSVSRHLGVEATVVGVIDLFGHEAVQGWADR